MNLKDLISILVDADKKIDSNKEVTEDAKDSKVDSVETPKEVKVEDKPDVTEVDPRDKRIKELEELLAQKDSIISQNSEQINALKELTSVDAPVDNNNYSLEELIEKGEF